MPCVYRPLYDQPDHLFGVVANPVYGVCTGLRGAAVIHQ